MRNSVRNFPGYRLMERAARVPFAIAAICMAYLAAAPGSHAQVNVLTRHNDGMRTGQNLSETTLNTSNVTQTQFGKLFTITVDGFTHAQPLYVSALAIPGQGTHNVLYVATEHDSVYAFDADTGAQLWTVNKGPSIPNTEIQAGNESCNTGVYPDMGPEVGIASTPVIDLSTNTLYCLSRSHANSIWTQTLHALDITTGAEKFGGPVNIPATVTTQAGSRNFNLGVQNQRAALALANGSIYICWASHGDCGGSTGYNGWVMSYNASTLALQSAFVDTPSNSPGMAGIWMTGNGPAVDATGNLYISTGNGTFNGNTTGTDFGMSFLKFGPGTTLSISDWFTPSNYANLNNGDYDLASGGPMLIPGTTLLTGTAKNGTIYLMNSTAMSHFHSAGDQIVSEFQYSANQSMNSPAFYNSPVNGPTSFFSSSGDTIKAYQIVGGAYNTTAISQSPEATPAGYSSGAALSVSANGSTSGTGILWAAMSISQDPNLLTVPGVLRAYDASNIGTELWNSQQNATRDALGNYAKWAPPTIANGKVYAPTFSNQVVVYGLLGTSVPSAPTNLIASPGNGQVSLTWTASGGATSYNVKRATVTGGPYTTIASPTTASFTNTGLTNGTTYYFVVSGVNSIGEGANSSQVSAAPTAGVPGAPTGLTATAGNAQVTLAWTAVTGAATYNAKRATVSGGPYTTIATGITATSYTNTGLTNGTVYYFVVSAVNANGEGSNSSQASATPNGAGSANIASGTATIDGVAEAAWNNATSYPLTKSTGTISSSADCSATWKGMWDTTNLYVLVSVTDDVKINDSVNPWDDDSIEVYIDGDNNKSTSYDTNDRQIDCGWGDTTPVEGAGRSITGVTFAKTDPTSTSYIIETKIPWAMLGVTVAANSLIGIDVHVNDDDDGGARDGKIEWNDGTDMAWSHPSLFGTGTLTGTVSIPSTPTGLAATAGNGQVSLTWNASAGATSYNVYRGTTTGGPYTLVTSGVATTSYTNTGLTNGTTYYFVVSATDSAGTSGNSAQASATPTVGIPAAPTGLTATAGSTQVSLSWTASTGATSYNVKRATVTGGPYTTIASPTTTSYVNTGLTNGTTYYYVVSAVNASGESANSNQASATPAAVTLPIQINAAGPAVSPFAADVDFTGGQAATNWTGTINTSAVTTPAPQAVYQSERYGASTYTVPGLVSGTAYTVRLHFCENLFTASGSRTFTVAINGTTVLTNFDIFAAAGAIHKANIQQFSTTGNASGQIVITFTNVVNNALVNGIEVLAAAPPAAPTGLTATGGNAQVSLSWTASTGATSYNVKRATVTGGPYTTIASPTVTTYTNTGLTDGTTYYYVVTAVNGSGESANSAQASAVPAQAQIAAGTATIDGVAEAAWNNATAYTFGKTSGTITNAADCSGTWKGMWDTSNLYILASITDDVKKNDSTNPWDDDAVEIYLDADHNGGTTYDANDRQVVCGWGDAAAVEGAGRAIAGVAFGKTDPTGTSYVIEVKIPWSIEAFTPAQNKVIGIDVHVDDDDDGGARDGKIMWNDGTDGAWGNPSLFGNARLN